MKTQLNLEKTKKTWGKSGKLREKENSGTMFLGVEGRLEPEFKLIKKLLKKNWQKTSEI